MIVMDFVYLLVLRLPWVGSVKYHWIFCQINFVYKHPASIDRFYHWVYLRGTNVNAFNYSLCHVNKQTQFTTVSVYWRCLYLYSDFYLMTSQITHCKPSVYTTSTHKIIPKCFLPRVLQTNIISLHIRSMWETICDAQAGFWLNSKFLSKFSGKPLSGISDQKAPPPPFWKTSDLRWPKFTPEYPPHFGKLQIWDDQSLLRNTPPFRKTSDLGWPKFTPEYPSPQNENCERVQVREFQNTESYYMWRLYPTRITTRLLFVNLHNTMYEPLTWLFLTWRLSVWKNRPAACLALILQTYCTIFSEQTYCNFPVVQVGHG